MFSDPFLEYRANVWDTQIRVKSMVGDIPWRIDHGSEKFGLISLDDRYISFGGITPQLYINLRFFLCKHYVFIVIIIRFMLFGNISLVLT